MQVPTVPAPAEVGISAATAPASNAMPQSSSSISSSLEGVVPQVAENEDRIAPTMTEVIKTEDTKSNVDNSLISPESGSEILSPPLAPVATPAEAQLPPSTTEVVAAVVDTGPKPGDELMSPTTQVPGQPSPIDDGPAQELQSPAGGPEPMSPPAMKSQEISPAELREEAVASLAETKTEEEAMLPPVADAVQAAAIQPTPRATSAPIEETADTTVKPDDSNEATRPEETEEPKITANTKAETEKLATTEKMTDGEEDKTAQAGTAPEPTAEKESSPIGQAEKGQKKTDGPAAASDLAAEGKEEWAGKEEDSGISRKQLKRKAGAKTGGAVRYSTIADAVAAINPSRQVLPEPREEEPPVMQPVQRRRSSSSSLGADLKLADVPTTAIAATSSRSKRQRRSAPTTSHDDTELTEPESMTTPMEKKPKRRRTQAPPSANAAQSVEQRQDAENDESQLTVHHLPSGWVAPLHYFSSYSDEQIYKQWWTLNDRLVSVGAVYLSPECSGMKGNKDIVEHCEGPTDILTDLVVLVEGDSTVMRPSAFVNSNRGTDRERINATKLPVFELGLLRCIKNPNNERDYVMPVPLDVIAATLVRHMKALAKLRNPYFPSHFFVPDFACWQYGYCTAFHNLQAGIGPQPAHLLECFCSNMHLSSRELRDLWKDVAIIYYGNTRVRAQIARTSVGRSRRSAHSTLLPLIAMDAREVKTVEKFCDAFNSMLEQFRYKTGDQNEVHPAAVQYPSPEVEYPEGFFNTEGFHEHEFILSDVATTVCARASAALRDRVYDYYDIPTLMLKLNSRFLRDDSTNHKRYDDCRRCLDKENKHVVDGSRKSVYVDLTLSSDQAKWIVSGDRFFESRGTSQRPSSGSSSRGTTPRKSRRWSPHSEKVSSRFREPEPQPETPAELQLLQYVIAHPALPHVANARLEFIPSRMESTGGVCTDHTFRWNLIATRDIAPAEKIQVADTGMRVTWGKIANDQPVEDEGADAEDADSEKDMAEEVAEKLTVAREKHIEMSDEEPS